MFQIAGVLQEETPVFLQLLYYLVVMLTTCLDV